MSSAGWGNEGDTFQTYYLVLFPLGNPQIINRCCRFMVKVSAALSGGRGARVAAAPGPAVLEARNWWEWLAGYRSVRGSAFGTWARTILNAALVKVHENYNTIPVFTLNRLIVHQKRQA